MSCIANACIERDADLPGDPDTVWEELIGGDWLGEDADLEPRPGGPVRVDGADGLRVGVVDDVVPGRRLAFWWSGAGDDAPPSYVEIELEPAGAGTRIHIRETVVDVDRVTSAPLARA
ncbi:MAG: SRPBCC domain-containing protein [Acidimicrobiia bacterium]